MKTPIIAAILLVLAVPAHARMRHDRICDMVQDKPHAFVRLYDPNGGGHGWRFGSCGFAEDVPEGNLVTLSGIWNSLACGYQAYREGKKLKAVPYKNSELVSQWKWGWKVAHKSCTEDMAPIFDPKDIEGSDH